MPGGALERALLAPGRMKRVERILVAVDECPCARTALEYAAELAARLGAEALVLHVLRPPGRSWSQALVLRGGRGGALKEALRARNGGSMDQLLAALERGASVSANARASDEPARAILAAAAEQAADLLVVGAHRRSWLRGLFGTSMAERVAREAPCPTLVVHLDDAFVHDMRWRERHAGTAEPGR